MEIDKYTQLLKSNTNWLPGKDAIANEIEQRYNVSPNFIDIQQIEKKKQRIARNIFL